MRGALGRSLKDGHAGPPISPRTRSPQVFHDDIHVVPANAACAAEICSHIPLIHDGYFESHATSWPKATYVVDILPLLHIPHDRFSRRIPSIQDDRFRRHLAPFLSDRNFISAFGCSSPCGSTAVSDIATGNAFARTDGLEPISACGIDVLAFRLLQCV